VKSLFYKQQRHLPSVRLIGVGADSPHSINLTNRLHAQRQQNPQVSSGGQDVSLTTNAITAPGFLSR
jgi:hypothetical protein